MVSRNEIKTLVLILILASGLRIAGIDFESMWLDEGYQSLIGSYGAAFQDFVSPSPQPFLYKFSNPVDPITMLANFRSVDPLCPPLYSLALNIWLHVFGDSDMAIRSLSAFFSVLSVAALYCLARAAYGLRAATFAALLQAVSPFDIYYAQEARMYALIMLLAVVAFGSLFRICRNPDFKPSMYVFGVLYAVCSWGLINSHYTCIFVVAASGLWGLFQVVRTKNIKLFAFLCVAWLLVLLMWLPWLGYFFQSAKIRSEAFYVLRDTKWWWPIYALFARIPINWLLFLDGKRVCGPLVLLYGTAALFIITSIANKKIESKGRDLRLGLWFWAIVPAILLWLVDVAEGRKVIEVTRYMIGTAPAIYILVGSSLSALTAQRLWQIVFLVHVILALANNTYQHLFLQKEPWAQMARTVEAKCTDEDFIFVCQPYDIVLLDRYLTKPFKQLGLSTAMTDEMIGQAVLDKSRFWLITAQEGSGVVTRLPAVFEKKAEYKMPHGLVLSLYERIVK